MANSEATAACAPAVGARGGTGKSDKSAAPSIPCDTDTRARPLAVAGPKVRARVSSGSVATTATSLHHSPEICPSPAAKATKRKQIESPPRDPSSTTKREKPRNTKRKDSPSKFLPLQLPQTQTSQALSTNYPLRVSHFITQQSAEQSTIKFVTSGRPGLGPRTHYGHDCCTWRAARGPKSKIPSSPPPAL